MTLHGKILHSQQIVIALCNFRIVSDTKYHNGLLVHYTRGRMILVWTQNG